MKFVQYKERSPGNRAQAVQGLQAIKKQGVII